ncbi:MAG: tetratricopeptide repeat protein [Verrucomicrobiota bacterium]
MLFQLKTPHRAALAITLVGAIVVSLAWWCVRDPKITFLPGDGRAEWILFPSAPDAMPRPVADLDAVFRREFTLDGQSRAARLIMRAAKRVQLKINGNPVDIGTSRNWKDLSSADVLACLRAGINMIEVRVFNDNGPPALWLVLVTDQLTLRSDQTWETSFAGSAWRQATLATAPRMPGRGNPLAGGEGTLAALAVVWPIWMVFGVFSIVIWMAGRRWLSHTQLPNAVAVAGLSRREAIVLLTFIAALWVALFCNNARLIPHAVGFDRRGHAGYIDYIQKHGALPLPNEGWETYQPPLYYGISAAALSSFGLTVSDAAGPIVLCLLTMLFGIIHFTLVFLSLRLLFPRQFGRQLVGLVLAAFLPMQLYLSHYVTNETLVAILVSAAIYLYLRLLRAEQATLAGYAGLGICLGAALLAKVTGILLVPVIVVALAGRLVVQKSTLVIWWRTLGVMVGTCFVVCGWYYLWIWLQCGTPLPKAQNWDVGSQFQWWQDNGYNTLAYFTRFGRSLVHPLFSGFWGFADGIYSTLWGDGLCGGASGMVFRPPWNYDLMVAGYLLAVLPTILVLVGAATSAVKLIYEGGADWFVLLGLAFAVWVGLIFLNLTVPNYSMVKSFYGLCALIPFCAFGAVGWEVLTRGRKWLQFALGTILLVWAMNSFAAVWTRGNAAATHMYLGTVFSRAGKMEAAAAEFAKAVNADPANAQARRFLASTLNESGKTNEALQQAEQAVELNPANAACHHVLSVILARQGQMERVIDEARRAVELGPEDLFTHRFLSDYLVRLGRDNEAVTAARNGLAVFPYDADLHYELGQALARKGDLMMATNQFAYALLFEPDWTEAHLNFGRALIHLGDAPNGLRHFREAVRLAPDSPLALNGLAWLLATYPDAAMRNGPEAVRLAEHACAVASRRNPALLATLAAAYAEAGRFPEAINAAQEAIALARTAGNEAAINRVENLLGFFQSGRPFHENTTPSP